MKKIISKILILLVSQFMCISSFSQVSDKTAITVRKEAAASLNICRLLHNNPELSLQESETSKMMASELGKAGFKVTENVGGNNVVGLFRNGDGPVILLRTDMDALPIEEKTGFPFASKKTMTDSSGKKVPVMHACGHDIHMSVWIGTLRTLIQLKDQWKGTLVAIAQQAEEVSGGADAAIAAGLFKRFPVPDYALALHINPEIESGKIGVTGGPVFAGVKTAEITVFGKGGHGATPEKCIDPIVIASRIVLDLQTIVSREMSPFDPVVITVGSIHGGTRPNIIPDEVKMELTLRYYSDEVIVKVTTAIKRICRAASQMAGMPDDKLPIVKISDTDTPPVMNNPELSEKIANYAATVIGRENIIKMTPAMVGEDFGKYGRTPEKVPICMIWLGSTSGELMKELAARGEKPAPLHSPGINPDYGKTIETGIKVMVANVMGLLKK
jgi:amidohydrolase